MVKVKKMKRYFKAVNIITVFVSIIVVLSCLKCVYADTSQGALPFKLLGTFSGSEPADSVAVMRDLGTELWGIYKAGDRISGYQITRITRGNVQFLKEGRAFVLELPMGNENRPVIVISDDERIINQAVLSKKIPNINTALTQALPIPYIEAGKITGFKITKIRDKVLADMAGLKEGDVVTRVNGERINSIRGALELYQKIKCQDNFNLEIKRNKLVQNIVYYIR